MDENKMKNVKGKEKRQVYSQNDLHSKRVSKFSMKNDLISIAPLQPLETSSPVKKYLNEASKIIKIGIEKEFALQEKDEALQKLSETIDNLRKNIIHLQMEYEKLDQNYQREISCRTEIVKRMDATRGIVDSAVHYSNTLSASVKQLEDDKLKIAEFYETIYAGQKEVEDKHSKLEKIIEEKEIFLKYKISEIRKVQDGITTQNAETISQLNQKLIQTKEKLELVTSNNEKLEEKLLELKESLHNLDVILVENKKVNSLQKEKLEKFESLFKNCKFQKFKYQKLFRNEKKKFESLRSGYKILKKKIHRIEGQSAKNRSEAEALRNENEELKTEISKYQKIIELNQKTWDSQKQEWNQKIIAKEEENNSLKTSNKVLEIQNLDLKKLVKENEIKIKDAFDDLYRITEDRSKLEENLKKLKEERDTARDLVNELEEKLKFHGDDMHSEVALYKSEVKKYEKMVKEAERRMEEVEKASSFERTQKDHLISELNQKINDNSKAFMQKTNELLAETEDKSEKIRKLLNEVKEKEDLVADLKSQMSDSTSKNSKTLDKLKDDYKSLSAKNDSLKSNLDILKEKNQSLSFELDQSRNQILVLERKIQEEKTENKSLKYDKTELEKNIADLKNEVDTEKKCCENFRQKQKKSETELQKLQKVAEENSNLKTSIVELKKLLEGSEAKVEAYKVVIKKLEAEKLEAKDKEEICNLKIDINHLEDILKKEAEKKQEAQDNAKDQENNEPGMPKVIAIGPGLSTPQQSKKFLTTPRKILSSTPQPSFRAFTPSRKKRDPYEFDSDSSVERFEPEQVLKVFNNRPKRESTKKSKTNK